ncbi:MAG: His/Gly/Thr/Pro-type tRNA ligase C-terminal domain-containing protein [Candidatus Gracilibacteria bacterium]|nr:His/Gly/Thr/Pro-type tRNA ligase C-terminal domain-containing protein [Candidatus Gracilibacteria bacterium]
MPSIKEDKVLKTRNMLPEDHKYLTFLKKVFRHEFRKNGFRRLSAPNFAEVELFKNVFGENYKDYVYTTKIDDFGEFCLTPSPEILNLRAYLNSELKEELQPVYSYFMDRFYPKNHCCIKGKTFFGGDVVGEDDPIIDAQLIFITYTVFNKIGLNGQFKIRINSIGNKKEQEKFKEELISFYEGKKHLLTPESQEKIHTNPISLLASENEDEKILAQNAPQSVKFLKKDSKAHYAKFKEYLDLLGIEYVEDNTLVPEYPYVNNNIWEFSLLESRKIISIGYRHNSLSTLLGADKEVPASSFTVDTWRVMDILRGRNIRIKNKDKLDLYFVQLGDDAKKVVLPLSLQACDAGINTSVSLGTPSMKEQMLKASRSGAKFVVMVGLMEARSGVFQVRNMEEGTQAEVKKDDLINYIVDKIGKESLDFYEPSRDLLTN